MLSPTTAPILALSLTRRIVRRFRGHTDRVTDMAFSSDARWLLSAAMDGHVRAWDVPNSRCLQVMVLGAPGKARSLTPPLARSHSPHLLTR